MKELRIKVKYICPGCDGNPEMANPKWIEWWDKIKELTGKEPTYPWKNIGDKLNRPMPPEYITCCKCEGKGEIEEWQSIEWAIKQVAKGIGEY